MAQLVVEGLTNREIANRLFISERTVDGHLEHIREKLAVNSRAQVAAWLVAQSRPTSAAAEAAPRSRNHPKPALVAAAIGTVTIIVLAGVLLNLWLRPANPASTPSSTSSVGVLKVVWSTDGANYPFSFPGPVTAGVNHTIYVLDRGNFMVQRLDLFGGHVSSWGGPGVAAGQFITYCPNDECPPACTGGFAVCQPLAGDLAVDRQGNVWVYDYTGRVQVFDADGKQLFTWGEKGNAMGQLSGLGALAFDSKGNVVISDTQTPRVQRFTTSGRYVDNVGQTNAFIMPGPLAIDSHDDVYIGDTRAGKILKYDSAGHLMWTSGVGVVTEPQVIAIDRNDNLWVLENQGIYLKKFKPDGSLVRKWSLSAFNYPSGLAIDADGNVFLTDLPGGSIPDVGRLSKVMPL